MSLPNRVSYPQRYKNIKALALQYGWREVDHQNTIFLVSFKKEDVRLNIYYSKMTVATVLTHPVKGRTQLFRKNVDKKLLIEIFKNPRIHTGRGYYGYNLQTPKEVPPKPVGFWAKVKRIWNFGRKNT